MIRTTYFKKAHRRPEESLNSIDAARQVINTILSSRDAESALLALRLNGIAAPDGIKLLLGVNDLVEMARQAGTADKTGQRAGALERQLKRVFWDARPETISDEEVRELLGDWALAHWLRLKDLPELLRLWGYIGIDERGYKFTETGVERLGMRVIQEIFRRGGRGLRWGTHPTARRFHSGTKTGETTPFKPGDPMFLSASRTIHQAVMRGSRGVPVRLRPEDLMVDEMENTEKASTVLLVDRSVSMREGVKILAAKKVSMALYALMRKTAPRDTLHLVSFCTRAHPMSPTELPNLRCDDRNPYTNMHEALQIACRLLRMERSSRRQAILITDGEPTAHLARGGVFFQSPPNRKTITATMEEARRLTRSGAELIVFMIGDDPSCRQFVSNIGKIGKGRTFFTTPDNLQECVLVDYMSRRMSRV
ncbi:MAG: VWA domain-containing protein [Deltaproteobacteria bacterium]|nr:VWA domain-containing protein [Deltaproteobacteria bacterium]